nr:acylphosphatase [Lysinibacillus timonensis]
MTKHENIHFHIKKSGALSPLLIHKWAIDLSLKGYCIQNQQSQYEIELEGKKTSIQEFIRFIQNGVLLKEQCTIERSKHLKGYSSFKINLV